MFWKKLFYASASVLMLAIAYHLGARSAGAQQGSPVMGVSAAMVDGNQAMVYVLTPNGDVYHRAMCVAVDGCAPLNYLGNFWGGAPVPRVARDVGALEGPLSLIGIACTRTLTR